MIYHKHLSLFLLFSEATSVLFCHHSNVMSARRPVIIYTLLNRLLQCCSTSSMLLPKNKTWSLSTDDVSTHDLIMVAAVLQLITLWYQNPAAACEF